MQSRIRDVRKAKGLTLADVAERCNPTTTAQTIGRLETGMRVLSLIWINRIADALSVNSSDLVALPDQQFLSVAAVLHEDGTHAPTKAERIMVPNIGGSMVGLRIAAAMGEYRRGDELCYDYGLVIDMRMTKKLKAAYECRCGSASCRGTMLAIKNKSGATKKKM
jgi:transcriptional regulator with XRE-family HTH domain